MEFLTEGSGAKSPNSGGRSPISGRKSPNNLTPADLDGGDDGGNGNKGDGASALPESFANRLDKPRRRLIINKLGRSYDHYPD